MSAFGYDDPHERELRQKLQLLGDPDRISKNPWLEKYGHNNTEDVTNAYFGCFLAVPFGRGSPWPAQAQSVGDFDKRNKHAGYAWMFQLLVEFAGDTELGTPSFCISQRSNPGFWKAAIRAYVKYTYFNDRTKAVVELLEHTRRRSPLFDPAVTDMIEDMRHKVAADLRNRGHMSAAAAEGAAVGDDRDNDNDPRGYADADGYGHDASMQNNLPVNLDGQDQVAAYQARVIDQRLAAERVRRLAEARRAHPEWSAQEAGAYVDEQMLQEQEDQEDAAFRELDDPDFDLEIVPGASGDVEGGEEGDNDEAEGAQGDNVLHELQAEQDMVARQLAMERLTQRNAEERRVEEWCLSLPAISVFHAVGGQIATTRMEVEERNARLQERPRHPGARPTLLYPPVPLDVNGRDQGQEQEHENGEENGGGGSGDGDNNHVSRVRYDTVLSYLTRVHWISDNVPILIWPLVPAENAPMTDVANALGSNMDRVLSDANDLYSRMGAGECKTVVKAFVFKGALKGEYHMLWAFLFRDRIDLTQSIKKIQKCQRERTMHNKNSGMIRRRGYKPYNEKYAHLIREKDFHPVFTYTQEHYMNSSRQVMGGIRNPAQETRGRISCNQFASLLEPFHPANVCTIHRALHRLRKCGAKLNGLTEKDFVSKIRGSDEQGTSFTFHTPSTVDSYTFNPYQVFWYDEKWLGLSQTLLPFRTERDDLPLQLITGQCRVDLKRGLVFRGDEDDDNNNDDGNDNAESDQAAQRADLDVYRDCMDDDNGQLNEEIDFNNVLVDKRHAMRSIPTLLQYRHGDVLVHYEAENTLARGKIEALLPDNPLDEPNRYKLYCEVQKAYRESALSKWATIWKIDGVVDHLATCSTIKAVLKFGAELVDPTKNASRSVTCHLPMLDPDMTPWGNSVVYKMLVLSKGCTIINCKIPFLAGGLLMTFDRNRPGKPNTNIQLCGGADVGKTFPLINFVKKNYITGTWDVEHRSSKRAQNIHTHFPPQILLCDEPPAYITDPKAEAKYYDEVQQMKDLLTSGMHSYTVFTQIEHDGRNIRTEDKIKTADPRTRGYCTNVAKDKDHPLGTRFLMVNVPRSNKPPEDYQYDAGKGFPPAVRMCFHTEQFCVVEVLTAIRIGVIPDVDMWLYKVIMRRFITIMRAWNVLDPKKGYRPVQVIEPFVRYETIVRGVVCARHVPGGALYNKPYDAQDVHKIAPYIVPTLEIIKTQLNLNIDEFIDMDLRTIAKAFCKYCRYNPELTPLQNYKQSLAQRYTIPYRMQRNPDYQGKTKKKKNRYYSGTTTTTTTDGTHGQQSQQNDTDTSDAQPEFLINLNEIRMTGRIDTIAQQLAPFCNGLTAKQVATTLSNLTRRSFKQPGGKRYTTMPEYMLCDYVIGGKTFPDEEGNDIQLQEDDIKEDNEWLMAGTFTNQDTRSGSFYLNPSILWYLKEDVVERAWLLATMHMNYPRGKFISGHINPDHPDLFEVDIYDDEFIRVFCEIQDSTHPNAPLLRSEGLAVNNRAQLTEFERQVLTVRRLDPTQTDHTGMFQDICNNRGERFKKIEDLELYAAQRVAWRCGDDTGVYYTDEQVHTNYDAYLKAHSNIKVPDKPLRYPSNIVKQRKDAEVEWASNNAQMATAQDLFQALEERNVSFRKSVDDQEGMSGIRKRRRRHQRHQQTNNTSAPEREYTHGSEYEPESEFEPEIEPEFVSPPRQQQHWRHRRRQSQRQPHQRVQSVRQKRARPVADTAATDTQHAPHASPRRTRPRVNGGGRQRLLQALETHVESPTY